MCNFLLMSREHGYPEWERETDPGPHLVPDCPLPARRLQLPAQEAHAGLAQGEVILYTGYSCWPGSSLGHTGHRLLYSIQAHAGLAQGGVIQHTDCCTVYKLVLVWLKVWPYSTQNAEHRTSSRWPGSRCGHTVHRLHSISDSVQSQVDVLYVHRLRSSTQAEEHNSGFCTLHRLLWHT
jgi:hypothetical protein